MEKRILAFLMAVVMFFVPMGELLASGMETDTERLEGGLAALGEWHKIINLDSEKDRNVVDIFKKDLENKGFSDIDVSVKSTSNKSYIDESGNIKYYFENPHKASYNKPQVEVVFSLSKGKVSLDTKAYNIPISWDKKRVVELIEEEVFKDLSEDNIRLDNEDLENVVGKLNLPKRPKKYVDVKWESSDEKVLEISDELQKGGADNFFNPYLGKVYRQGEDKRVKLTSTVNFNHENIEVKKEYNILVKAIDNKEILKHMQEELDEKYTLDKLKDFSSKSSLKSDLIVGDIQLPRSSKNDLGMEKYYKLSATSNSEYAKVMGNRINITRPTDQDEKFILTVGIEDTTSKLSVKKEIPLVIKAEDEKIFEDIEKDLAKMEKAKEIFFEGVKGENIDRDKINSDLKNLKAIDFKDDGFEYIYDIASIRDDMVVVDSIEGWEVQEAWRNYRSSKPNIIGHENLQVNIPDFDTDVEIETRLSIPKYEKYKDDERIKGFYKEPFTLKVKVLGKNNLVDNEKLDREIEFLKKVYAEKFKKRKVNNPLISRQGTMSAKLTGFDKKTIEDSMDIDEKNASAFQLAQSIVTLVGADVDPKAYYDKKTRKTRNLVEELEAMQMETGEFASSEREKLNLLFQLRSIIALDLVDGNYDEVKAIERLIEVYNLRGEPGVLNNKLLEAEGLMLLALSNHREKPGVQDTIDKIIDIIIENQNDDGGFNMRNASSKGINTPLATGRIIQGLVSIGINPLKDGRFIKNNKTMLDSLVKSKVEKEDLVFSGYSRGEGEEYSYGEATDIAFGALLDLKNDRSMFHILSFKGGEEAKFVEVDEVVASLEVNEEKHLVARVYDGNKKLLTNKEVEWLSSDQEILEVSNGRIRGISEGTAEVRVRVKGSKIETKFDVEVLEEVKEIEVYSSIVYFDKDGDYHIDTIPKKTKLGKDRDGQFTVLHLTKVLAGDSDFSTGFIKDINGIKLPETGGWMYSLNDKYSENMPSHQELKDGDIVIWYGTYDYTRDRAPLWKELLEKSGVDFEESSLSLNIKNKIRQGKVGQSIKLDIEVFEGDKNISKDYIIKLGDPSMARLEEDNTITLLSKGNLEIEVYLKDNIKIKDNFRLEIIEEKIELGKVLEELSEKYEEKDSLSFREILGMKALAKDKVDLRNKISLVENNSANNMAQNIISIIVGGENPYDYKGIDYVESLMKTQNGEGKFIAGPYDDYAGTQSFVLIALDMAGVDYDKKFVDTILSYQDIDGSFSSFKDVDTVAMVLQGLGNHMDREKVKESVEKAMGFIEGNQTEFNQYTIAQVIQGFIAVGKEVEPSLIEEVLAYYRSENLFGNDMANEQVFLALVDYSNKSSVYKDIRFRKDSLEKLEIVGLEKEISKDRFYKLFGRGLDKDGKQTYVENLEWKIDKPSLAAIDQSGRFIAKKAGEVEISLTDKATGISVSQKVEIVDSIFTGLVRGDKIIDGNKLDIDIDFKNEVSRDVEVQFIITSYDKDGNMIEYVVEDRKVFGNKSEKLEKEIDTRNISKVKVFIWDDMKKQNILLEENLEYIKKAI